MRRLTDDDLERLESFLKGLGDDAMLLSELDGYLAGVIVCPETIPPSEWLPSVWGSDDPTFESKAEMEEVFAILMAFYNAIAHALGRTDGYIPHLEIDGAGSTIWELWASGFGRAVDLRPWAWKSYETAPDDHPEAMALRLLLLLAEAADTPGGVDLPETLDRSLREAGDGVLAACVVDLHRSRLSAMKAQRPAKAGRNDPCPCGSGKKYKKCCGQADIM